MRETKKAAIKRLKDSGEKELYCVTCRMQNSDAGTDLWNIYNDYDDAMRWVDLCCAYDALQPGFKETDYKSLDEFHDVCANYNVKLCTYEYESNGVQTTFVFERVA